MQGKTSVLWVVSGADMHAWEAINQSLNVIEEHLKEEISTEYLADFVGLSPFYFQRLFKRLVKKPVQEYIKLRRLARVIETLNEPGQRILDAALEYGFSSHANFTRAFKETYGLTPEDYRKAPQMLNTFERPEVAMDYILIDEGVPLITGNIVLEIGRKTLMQPETYLGFETEVRISRQMPVGESTGIDIPGELWRRYHREKSSMALYLKDGREMGMSHSFDPRQGTFRYFAGGLVEDGSGELTGDVVKKELPEGEYIVCRVEAENFQELVTFALDQANKYLFQTWLPRHDLVTEPFSVEKYYRDRKDMVCMEIWVKPLPSKEV